MSISSYNVLFYSQRQYPTEGMFCGPNAGITGGMGQTKRRQFRVVLTHSIPQPVYVFPIVARHTIPTSVQRTAFHQAHHRSE
jgi:hypothetical protein